MSGNMGKMSDAEMVGGSTQVTSKIAMAVHNILLAWSRFRFGHHEASLVVAGLVSEVLSQAGARDVMLARLGARNLIERLQPVTEVEDQALMMRHLLLMRRKSLFVDDVDTVDGQMQQTVDALMRGRVEFREKLVQVLVDLGHVGMAFSHEAGPVTLEEVAESMKAAAGVIIDRALLGKVEHGDQLKVVD